MRLWGQRLIIAGIVLGVALGSLGLFDSSHSHAAITARITQAGDGIELEYVGEDGKSVKELIPLHKKGSARYFSTGIGMEERTAQYPRFPLKLVFWLFVDLPAGTYDITAVRRDRAEIKQRVAVIPGRTKVAYFRWKE